MDKFKKFIVSGVTFAAIGYYAYEKMKAKRQQEVIELTDYTTEEVEPEKK